MRVTSVRAREVVLFFDTAGEAMLKRLLNRSETSGRDDDNIESIRKRFRTFVETSMPVVENYEKLGKALGSTLAGPSMRYTPR